MLNCILIFSVFVLHRNIGVVVQTFAWIKEGPIFFFLVGNFGSNYPHCIWFEGFGSCLCKPVYNVFFIVILVHLGLLIYFFILSATCLVVICFKIVLEMFCWSILIKTMTRSEVFQFKVHRIGPIYHNAR